MSKKGSDPLRDTPAARAVWIKARCLAALQGRLPDAFTVDAAFKLPVRLPAKVALASWTEGEARRFALHDARTGKLHLDGTFTAFASAASAA